MERASQYGENAAVRFWGWKGRGALPTTADGVYSFLYLRPKFIERKHRISFGWPRQGSRHCRFTISNAVWEHRLKPLAFEILSYLCYQHSHGGINLSPELVAKGIHKSDGTVSKYLSVLRDAGLVAEECSLAAEFSSADGGKFFTLPNEIFLLNLPPSTFVACVYLLLIEDRKTHTCHPSCNTISTATGMSKNTVIKSIGTLFEKHLIAIEHSHYLDQRGMKWNGNNLYTILPMQRAMDVFHQRQLCQLEAEAHHRKLRRRQGCRTRQETVSASANVTPAP